MSDARLSMSGAERQPMHSDMGFPQQLPTLTVKLSSFEDLLAAVSDHVWVGQVRRSYPVTGGRYGSLCLMRPAVAWVDLGVGVPRLHAARWRLRLHPFRVQCVLQGAQGAVLRGGCCWAVAPRTCNSLLWYRTLLIQCMRRPLQLLSPHVACG